MNGVRVKDIYLILRTDESLDLIREARIFSILHTSSGLWQIEMKEWDKDTTRLALHHGLIFSYIVWSEEHIRKIPTRDGYYTGSSQVAFSARKPGNVVMFLRSTETSEHLMWCTGTTVRSRSVIESEEVLLVQ